MKKHGSRPYAMVVTVSDAFKEEVATYVVSSVTPKQALCTVLRRLYLEEELEGGSTIGDAAPFEESFVTLRDWLAEWAELQISVHSLASLLNGGKLVGPR